MIEDDHSSHSQLAGVAGRIYRECWLITIIGSGNNLVLLFLNQYLPLTSILNYYIYTLQSYLREGVRKNAVKGVWGLELSLFLKQKCKL